MSSQLDPVAELESLKTHVEHSGKQSGETSELSPNGSPGKENEHQGEHSHHKKSLLTKIKDKAKKLQHSLSTKKRHDEEGDATLSPFGRSDDHEGRESRGYASLSPHDKSKDSKDREAGGSVSLSPRDKSKDSRDREAGGSASFSPHDRSQDRKVREAGGYESLSPHYKSKDSKVREEGEDPEYLGAPMYESKKAPEELKETARQHPRENHVITETNFLSILPAKHNGEQDQKECCDSKIENPVISEKNVLSDVKEEKPADSDTTTVTEPIAEKTGKECTNQEPNSPSKTVTETVTEKLAPAYAKVSDATHAITKKIQDMAFPESTEPEAETNNVSEINTAGSNNPTGFNTQVWDKGVSMKEYIIQKFEPGEDDKALSQVISEAISPRKASSKAVTFNGARNMVPAPNSADNKAPLLVNTHEIAEEENHGKILQPN